MKDGKMRNPLCKRIVRELKRDWKKYLVVALFLILTIGFVSGMYVANGSMMQAAAEGKEKYHLEDGHFELDQKADQELIRAIETGEKADVKQFYPDQAKMELDDSDFSAVPVTVYENIYRSELENRGFVVFGNEGQGIGAKVAKHVDKRLLIPSYSESETSESLNVGVAAAIVVSEFRRTALKAK